MILFLLIFFTFCPVVNGYCATDDNVTYDGVNFVFSESKVNVYATPAGGGGKWVY